VAVGLTAGIALSPQKLTQSVLTGACLCEALPTLRVTAQFT
jgi:hypothetical protein